MHHAFSCYILKDKTAAMTLRTKRDLKCKELEESIKLGEEVLEANKREIEELDVKISTAKKELQSHVQPKYEQAKTSLTRITTERSEAQKKMEGLYAKQGRGRQYHTKEDRDAYLISRY